MQSLFLVLFIAAPLAVGLLAEPQAAHKGHRHHHHGHHHKKHAAVVNASVRATVVKANFQAGSTSTSTVNASATRATNLLNKMKKMEADLAAKERHETAARRGEIELNGPLPADFSDRFAKEVAKATGCKPEDVRVLNTTMVKGEQGVDEIIFEAPPDIIQAVQEQAADPDSKLANGPLRIFLIEKAGDADDSADSRDSKESAELKEKDSKLEKEDEEDSKDEKKKKQSHGHHGDDDAEEGAEAPDGLKPKKESAESADGEEESADSADGEDQTPVQDKGIDIDTSMPYGELEPFGREDTAQELTRGSIRESDEMVDQLERAEVAEEKRAVFRALTRLRGAAITSFDGVARSQTGNIDSYARTNHWRSTHPVRHLASEEDDVGKWAFPDNADF